MMRKNVPVVLVVLLVLIPCLVLKFSLADVAATSQQCEENDGSCKMNQVFDVFGSWANGVSEETSKFLNENVLNQDEEKANETPDASGIFPEEKKEEKGVVGLIQETQKFFIDVFHQEKKSKSDEADSAFQEMASATNEGISGMKNVFSSLLTSDKPSDSAVHTVLEQAQHFSTAKKMKRNFGEIFSVFQDAFKKAKDSVDKHFGHIDFKSSLPISLWYWIEREDEVKTASWKRREHRFYKDVNVDTVKDLHDALYLSQLSYVDTVDELKDGLKDFAYQMELVYAQVESFPGEPAHFITLVKESKGPKIKFPWQKDDALDVVMVVRGTKELGDMLSDVIMDATDYRDGKSHDGVASAGKYLVKTHLDLMKHLLEVSGRKIIRLTMTGHSLGAGAAAIAAIEFNDHDFMEARAIGFGCPALLTSELSESTKDYITTVIADSDVVPRTSGATVGNVILDVMSFDWTDRAIVDIRQLLKAIDENSFLDVPSDAVIDHVEAHFDEHDRPFFDEVPETRVEPVLIPPGNCIHIYRDGVGFTAKYTPCAFFDSIDVTRTMILDHLADTGYHRALLGFVRDQLDDLNFSFRNDLLALPA